MFQKRTGAPDSANGNAAAWYTCMGTLIYTGLRMKSQRLRAGAVLVALTLIAYGPGAVAGDRFFDPVDNFFPCGQSFNDPNCWDGGPPPGASDDAYFAGPGVIYQVNFFQNSSSNQVFVRAPVVTWNMLADYAFGSGVSVADTDNSNVQLNLIGVPGTVVGHTGLGPGPLEIAGGANSVATVNITSGIVFNPSHVEIASGVGSTGTLLLNGAGTELVPWVFAAAHPPSMRIHSGGELIVRNGAKVTAFSTIQNSGTVNIDGGTISAYGYSSTGGVLDIDDGKLTVQVFNDPVRRFVLDSKDAASHAHLVFKRDLGRFYDITTRTSSAAVVGDANNATLELLDGVEWESGNLIIGQSASGNGTVTVADYYDNFSSNSTLSGNTLQVGSAGNGTLNIFDGGEVITRAAAIVGFGVVNPAARGSVTLRGATAGNDLALSRWTVGGDLTVGLHGLGEVVVEDVARLQTQDTFIGALASGSGAIRITGKPIRPLAHVDAGPSNWEAAGSVYVGGDDNGSGGTGVIEIANGAVVDIAGQVMNYAGGSVTVNDSTLIASSINNLGMFRIEGTGDSNVDADFMHAGTASLFVDTDATAVFDGDYSGAGAITGGGTVVFNGEVSPGMSPARVQVAGDVVLGASSRTVMEIGGLAYGSEHDALEVTDTLTLGGTLQVELTDFVAPLFTPSVDDSFILFAAGVILSSFDQFELAPLSADQKWVFEVRTDAFGLLDLGVLSVAAVPLPAGLWLMLAALPVLRIHRRVRHSVTSGYCA